MRNLRDYLDDLLFEVDAVARFTAQGRAVFMADDRTQYAVMMAYARIGEIAKRIPDELLLSVPDVEWRDVKGFRDVLMHRYFEIRAERVWLAVEKLPELRAAIDALIASLPPDEA